MAIQSMLDKIATVKKNLDTLLGVIDGKLRNKADKTTVYTKTETDERIQSLIGAAPKALDTLSELAKALNDDPDFAKTITTELAKKANLADVYDKAAAAAEFLAIQATAADSHQLGGQKPDYYATKAACDDVSSSLEKALDALAKSLTDGADLLNGTTTASTK